MTLILTIRQTSNKKVLFEVATGVKRRFKLMTGEKVEVEIVSPVSIKEISLTIIFDLGYVLNTILCFVSLDFLCCDF